MLYKYMIVVMSCYVAKKIIIYDITAITCIYMLISIEIYFRECLEITGSSCSVHR